MKKDVLKARILSKVLEALGKSEFERNVLLKTLEIKKGNTISYSELARAIGKPRAYRAVGNALHNNPLPFIIPCHRVVRTSGVGGYRFGYGLKLFLLSLENARLRLRNK